MMKPAKKGSKTGLMGDQAWRKVPASDQAAYKLNVMLAEMELKTGNYQKSATYYLAALKIYFKTDVYKQTIQCIRHISGVHQNKFLYKLGKCLLFHCHQSELAQETLHKLSILDPSFLRPVQKIFMMYEDENSADRRELTEIIEKTTKSRKIPRSASPAQRPNPPRPSPQEIQPVSSTLQNEADPRNDAETPTETELRISFEETGEHFRINKDLTDSTSIDKETLDDLMDSLLTGD